MHFIQRRRSLRHAKEGAGIRGKGIYEKKNKIPSHQFFRIPNTISAMQHGLALASQGLQAFKSTTMKSVMMSCLSPTRHRSKAERDGASILAAMSDSETKSDQPIGEIRCAAAPATTATDDYGLSSVAPFVGALPSSLRPDDEYSSTGSDGEDDFIGMDCIEAGYKEEEEENAEQQTRAVPDDLSSSIRTTALNVSVAAQPTHGSSAAAAQTINRLAPSVKLEPGLSPEEDVKSGGLSVKVKTETDAVRTQVPPTSLAAQVPQIGPADGGSRFVQDPSAPIAISKLAENLVRVKTENEVGALPAPNPKTFELPEKNSHPIRAKRSKRKFEIPSDDLKNPGSDSEDDWVPSTKRSLTKKKRNSKRVRTRRVRNRRELDHIDRVLRSAVGNAFGRLRSGPPSRGR